MKYYVYFLQSLNDKKFYIGCTNNVAERLRRHNAGSNKSTKNRQPFILVYQEEFGDKHSAFRREFFLKSPRGFLEKKKIIQNLIYSGVAQWVRNKSFYS